MSKEIVDPRIKKFKKIIAVDPYTQKNYEYRDSVLKSTEKLSLDNKNFIIAYVRNKDMI